MSKKSTWQLWLKTTSNPTLQDKQLVWNEWERTCGWVYVAKVGTTPNFFKVGMTGRDNPFLRVHELSTSVSSTESFELVWSHFFINRQSAEKNIHKILKNKGMHRGKEFFEVELNYLKQQLQRIELLDAEVWPGWNTSAFSHAKRFELWAPHAFDFDDWLTHR